MLKPESSPLECFALAYAKEDAMCKTCAHRTKCREFMGLRTERIALGQAKFSLVPDEYVRRHEEPDADRRDIDAIYAECYLQVYGVGPDKMAGVGMFRERIFRAAATAKLDLHMFVLVNMYGYSVTYPEKKFTPGVLADNRAVYRAKVYATACIERYGAISTKLLDITVGSDLSEFDLSRRMLASETKAATWIIDYKLWHPGLPYEPMFEDVQNLLDPAWLAIEKHYADTLQYYAAREDQPNDPTVMDTRHQAVMTHKRLKKSKHEAIAYFRARERIMNDAIGQVLSAYGYQGNDFEVDNTPITDPLLFWNRLGVTMQHLECLLYVNYREGIYAAK